VEVNFEYPSGATPLDPDEAQGLIPRHITLQAQLNEWEAANILEAEQWAFGRLRREPPDVDFLRRLHRRMIDRTWRWAGSFRSSGKNLGVAAWDIQPALRNVCADVALQLEQPAMPLDEIAARYAHRLVSIHPFPNGNGRWSRLAADVLLAGQGAARFTWGLATPESIANARDRYLAALRAADQHDVRALIDFARS
jgi:Fic-DOC domain mobile mystery protein B